MEDEALLRLLREDAGRGLYELTQKYGALMAGAARRILPDDPEDAEEAAADALVRIWRSAGTVELCGGTLRGFVLWAARAAAIDRYRVLRRERGRTAEGGDELLETVADPDSTETQAEQAHTLRAAERYIRALPPPDGAIFLRRFVLGESVPAIARALNMNLKAVESRLQRGRPKLREALRKEVLTEE